MALFRKDKDKDKDKEKAGAASAVEPPPTCPHVAMSARWDDLNDMGQEDRASSWVCQSCSEVFTPAEVAHLRATEAERLRVN